MKFKTMKSWDEALFVVVVVIKLYFDTVFTLRCKITIIKKSKNTKTILTNKLTTSSTNKKPALQGCRIQLFRERLSN